MDLVCAEGFALLILIFPANLVLNVLKVVHTSSAGLTLKTLERTDALSELRHNVLDNLLRPSLFGVVGARRADC